MLPLPLDAQIHFVRTEEFDGPLELLLFLARRQGVDLFNLRVAPLADAYLAHLDTIAALDLDLASDFLVLASTLCLLKSRELLPRAAVAEEEPEDEEVSREALIRRLVEYERVREASQKLANRPWLGRDEFARPSYELPEDQRVVVPGVDAMGLLQVLYDVLVRKAEPAPVHEIVLEHYSLREMAIWLLGRLSSGPRSLGDLLGMLEHRNDRVIAFLASLEMARLQLLDLQQSHHLAPVLMQPRFATDEADLSALVGNVG
jgi:segregation and condensation protein A